MIKQYFLILLLLILVNFTTAQSWQWARRGGSNSGTSDDLIHNMAVDKNGNTYSIVTFEGGSRSISLSNNTDTSINVIGATDIGIISYNKCGKYRWHKVIGTLSDDYAVRLGVDTLGNVYASYNARYFDIMIDNDTLLPNTNHRAIGLVKYDSSGHYKWVRQAEPDTTTYGASNLINSFTDKNGDTYLLCLFNNTGLISKSTNLVITEKNKYYVLKYNSNGIPKELIKLDIIDGRATLNAYNSQFHHSSSGKYFISASIQFPSTPYQFYFGTKKINKPLVIACFSSTGQLVWEVENSDSAKKNTRATTYWDEDRKLLFFGGSVFNTDTILGHAGANQIPNPNEFITFSLMGCLDTLGNAVWIKHAYQVNYGSSLQPGTITSDGKLYTGGITTGKVNWGSGFTYDSKGIGQGYLAIFDALTGTVLGLDSVRGGDATVIQVFGSDLQNNVYLGGQMAYDVKIGSQTLYSIGGSYDYFIAKYGFNNCSVVPLKMLDFGCHIFDIKNVAANWITANEVNVSHYNVQRSIDGRNFENIGKVYAKNTSYNEYTFNELLATSYLSFSTLYYRIESVDLDGQISYSETRSIDLKIENNEIRIYPNPAKDVVTIECKGAKELLMIDYLGRIVYRSTVDSQPLTVNTKQLPKGLYLVQVITSKGEVKTSKLIIE